MLNYRRCESGVSEMLRMISLEMDQIEEIQREFNGGAINLEDIENRQIATCWKIRSICQYSLI